MNQLEKRFGYKNDQSCDSTQDLIKLAKESHGISISKEFDRAIRKKMSVPIV